MNLEAEKSLYPAPSGTPIPEQVQWDPPLLCITRHKAGPASPLAAHTGESRLSRAESKPGDFPHWIPMGAAPHSRREVPLRALPGVSFSSQCKAQLRNCFFHRPSSSAPRAHGVLSPQPRSSH